MSRYSRAALGLACTLVLALSRPGAAASAGQREPRPNIVFLCSDDHAYQAISAYGDPRRLIETPHIDRLGREGVRFDRCLVPNSICGPSRASILTGKYSHLNGFYNNTNSRFDGAQPTFPKLLRAAGYQTALIGKWHLVSDPTGFDEWHILPGQGVYYNPPMIHNGRRERHQGYVTDLITDLSLDWLKSRDKSKPFLLMCQHKAPHREWEPALRHLGHDGDRKYPEPPTLFDDYAGRGKAEHDQDMTIARTMNDKDLKLTPPAGLTPEQRKAWDAYYEPRNAAFREAEPQGQGPRPLEVPALHARLPRLRQGRRRGRRPRPQVPRRRGAGREHDRRLLGRPGVLPRRARLVRQAVDLRGVAPRPAARALAGRGEAGDGERASSSRTSTSPRRSSTPPACPSPPTCRAAASSRCSRARPRPTGGSSFYYEYYEYPVPHHVRPHYGVVTDRYKLVHFYAPDVDYWELFDLKTDPHELRSVYDDPAYAGVVKDLKAEVARLRGGVESPGESSRVGLRPGGRPAGR